MCIDQILRDGKELEYCTISELNSFLVSYRLQAGKSDRRSLINCILQYWVWFCSQMLHAFVLSFDHSKEST